jgi:hypothetical protein
MRRLTVNPIPCSCGCGAMILAHTNGKDRKFVHGHNRRKHQLSWTVNASGCWIWDGLLNTNGYGSFFAGTGRVPVLAHRHVYELYRGPIPEGLILDHTCRTPACVNPDHLEPVTYAVNNRRGNATLLTVESVIAMRNEYASGESLPLLSDKYGVRERTVYSIVIGRRWQDVEGPITKRGRSCR